MHMNLNVHSDNHWKGENNQNKSATNNLEIPSGSNIIRIKLIVLEILE